VKLVALTIVLLLAAACSTGAVDPPEVAQRKTECKRLEAHILRISPESRGELDGLSGPEQQKRLEQLVAKVPFEDIQQCAAAEPAVIACMQKAPDVAAVRACIPPPNKG
jgi:cytochrome c556